MKIIFLGKIPEPTKKPWWVGIGIECHSCKTHVELEDGDTVRSEIERRAGGSRLVEITCPTCGEKTSRKF